MARTGTEARPDSVETSAPASTARNGLAAARPTPMSESDFVSVLGRRPTVKMLNRRRLSRAVANSTCMDVLVVTLLLEPIATSDDRRRIGRITERSTADLEARKRELGPTRGSHKFYSDTPTRVSMLDWIWGLMPNSVMVGDLPIAKYSKRLVKSYSTLSVRYYFVGCL